MTESVLVSLEIILQHCLEHVPVDVTALLCQVEHRWEHFLQGNLLDRLIFVLLCENDQRISSNTTKFQVMSILQALASLCHLGKTRVRLALQSNSNWFEWSYKIKMVRIITIAYEFLMRTCRR